MLRKLLLEDGNLETNVQPNNLIYTDHTNYNQEIFEEFIGGQYRRRKLPSPKNVNLQINCPMMECY